MKPETLELIALNLFRRQAVPERGDLASYGDYEAYYRAMLENTYSPKEAQKRLVLEMAHLVPSRQRDFALLYREVLLGCEPQYLLRTLYGIYGDGLKSADGVILQAEGRIALVRRLSGYAVRTSRGEMLHPNLEAARLAFDRLVQRAETKRRKEFFMW